MGENAIDLKEFLERVQDDKELLLELLDIYQEDFVEKRKSLGEATDKKDVEQIKSVAHSMKGSSGNVSAKALHALCLRIEQAAKAGDTNIGPLLSEMDQLFSKVKENIGQIKQELKS